MLIKGMNPVSMMANYVRMVKNTEEYQNVHVPTPKISELPKTRLSGLSTYAQTYEPNDLVLDKPVFVFHQIGRPYKSSEFGETIYLEIPGCMNRCGYCYVTVSNLGDAKFDDPQYQEYREERMPQQFKGRGIFNVPEIHQYLVIKQQERINQGKPILDSSTIGSGETVSNIWAIAELGHTIKDNDTPLILEVDTTGFPLISNPDLVELLEGLGGTPGIVNFYLSIFKGRNAEEDKRVTQTQSTFWDAGPKLSAWLIANGLWVLPAGIQTPLFAHPNPKDLDRIQDTKYVKTNEYGEKYFTKAYYEKLAYETARWLHDELSAIHPLYPKLLIYHGVTRGNNIEDSAYQEQKMREAGFIIESKYLTVMDRDQKVPKKLVHTMPSIFSQALNEVFTERGTTMIHPTLNDPAFRNKDYVETMATIINDLSKKKELIRQELVNYRQQAQARFKKEVNAFKAAKNSTTEQKLHIA